MEKVEKEARQSERGVQQHNRMKKLVDSAVHAATKKEEDALKQLKQKWVISKDAAFQKSLHILNSKQAKDQRRATAHISSAQLKMAALSHSKPAQVAKALSNKIQKMSYQANCKQQQMSC